MSDQIHRDQIDHQLEKEYFDSRHRKREHIKNLFLMARNDVTIKQFLDGWMAGYFDSFETMMFRMAIQLSLEKTKLLENAIKNIEVSLTKSLKLEADDEPD